MPVTPTCPGVYVEEIHAGVRPITGVATSITAFIGRALRGPVNTAVTISCFAEFERLFGGLWVESSLGYAVRDYYLNGGCLAVIVRLYHADPGDPHAVPPRPACSSRARVTAGAVKLEAAQEGRWGASLRAVVDTQVSETAARQMGLGKDEIFNLTVTDESPCRFSERHLNLSYKNSPRRIDKVLEAESSLVRWDSTSPIDQDRLPAVAPACDPVTAAEKILAESKQTDPPTPAGVATAEAVLQEARKAMQEAVSDGLALTRKEDLTPDGARQDRKGLYALEQLFDQGGLFNLLCIPPYLEDGNVEAALIAEAAAYCEERRALLLVDPPADWQDAARVRDRLMEAGTEVIGTRSPNAALYFPRLKQPNPLRGDQIEDFVPCGAVAGVFARTDAHRGVWKAPAGLEAALIGAPRLSVFMTPEQNAELNRLRINCLREFPGTGPVVWGARTLGGADPQSDEYLYVPVRRLALFIQESLIRGLKWAVFEPNAEPLWAQIRLNTAAFLHHLFCQGAVQGSTPREAYVVQCGRETTTQADIERGIVTVVVGFAPLKPAEFVIFRLQQMAGQVRTQEQTWPGPV